MTKSSPTRQALAAEVRAALARRQVTQSDLAAAIGVSQGSLSERLRGLRAFDLDELEAIATHLDVELLDLISAARSAA